MHQNVKSDFVAALRSGKYKKTKYQLRTIDDKFCVNGVLCDLADQAGVKMRIAEYSSLDGAADKNGNRPPTNYSYDGHGAFPPLAVLRWAGIEKPSEFLLNRLASKNDSGASWDALADLVEEMF